MDGNTIAAWGAGHYLSDFYIDALLFSAFGAAVCPCRYEQMEASSLSDADDCLGGVSEL